MILNMYVYTFTFDYFISYNFHIYKYVPVFIHWQFVCGLSLCCGTIANLSREEIQQVVDFYRTEDGRVRYKEFSHMMENGKFVDIPQY